MVMRKWSGSFLCPQSDEYIITFMYRAILRLPSLSSPPVSLFPNLALSRSLSTSRSFSTSSPLAMRPPFVGRRFLNILPRRRPSATRVLRSLHTFYKRGDPNVDAPPKRERRKPLYCAFRRPFSASRSRAPAVQVLTLLCSSFQPASLMHGTIRQPSGIPCPSA